MTEKTIHILGMRRNWRLNQWHVFALISAIGTIIFLMVGLGFYSILKHLELNQLQDSLLNQKREISQLQQQLESMQNEFSAKIKILEQSLSEKSTLLQSLQSQVENGHGAGLSGQTDTPQIPIVIRNRLISQEKLIKQKNNELQHLSSQVSQQESQLSSVSVELSQTRSRLVELNKIVGDLKTQVEESEDSLGTEEKLNEIYLLRPFENLASIKDANVLAIEKLQFTGNQDSLKVQFNLKNVSNTTQTGFLRMVPGFADLDDKPLEFNLSQSTTFHIRRFRPFNLKYNLVDNQDFTRFRIMVWNNNKEVILDKLYRIEQR